MSKSPSGFLVTDRDVNSATFENEAGTQSREIIVRQIKITSCEISRKRILKNDCGLFYILEFTFVWNINLWKTKQSLTHSHFRGRHKQRCCALSEHSSGEALCYSKTSTLQTHTYEKLK